MYCKHEQLRNDQLTGIPSNFVKHSEAYLEPSRTSTMELFG